MLEPPRSCAGTLHTLLALCWCVSSRGAELEPPEREHQHPKHETHQHSEPKRTYTNHTSTELARCGSCRFE